MLTNDQKALLKRAQRQAGLTDAEYREALNLLAGVRSSTDPKLGNTCLDSLLAYFEAIYWRKVDLREAPLPGGNDVFRRRGYWAGRNRQGNTSRNRFAERQFQEEINGLEHRLQECGKGAAYFAGIRRRTGARRSAYAAALRRTVAALDAGR